MLIKYKTNNFFYSFFIIFALYCGHALKMAATKPKIKNINQEIQFTFNENLLYFINGGNQRLIASYLWVTTLLNGDEKHIKGKKDSWMFYRFKAIAKLNPYFYQNYFSGGLYLSIVKDDLLGAEYIYKKGLEYYPLNYSLLYYRSFNLYFEMKNHQEGLHSYYLLGKIPNILKRFPYYNRLLRRIEKKYIDQNSSALILQDFLNNISDPKIKKAFLKKIKNKK